MELKGKVKAGFGVGAKYIEKMRKSFYKKYGIDLFPGTLNIELDKQYILKSKELIKSNEYGGNQDVLIKRIKIFNEEAFIVRAELNNKIGGEQSASILEIVSNINFRKEYNLKDGDECIIII